MIAFTDLNIFIRSSVNGAMALSALLVIVIFGRYVWRNKHTIWTSGATQAACAILLLMVGHLFRAASSWTEFTLVAMNLSTETWLQWTWVWFLIAVALILVGKAYMINVFAPKRWRWWAVGIGMPLTLVIPVIIVTVVLIKW
jgi:Ca2+/Na+ antiporter